MSIPIPANDPVVVPAVSSDTLDRWGIESFSLFTDPVTEVRSVQATMVASSATKRSLTKKVQFSIPDLIEYAMEDETLLGLVMELEPLLLAAASRIMTLRDILDIPE